MTFNLKEKSYFFNLIIKFQNYHFLMLLYNVHFVHFVS